MSIRKNPDLKFPPRGLWIAPDSSKHLSRNEPYYISVNFIDWPFVCFILDMASSFITAEGVVHSGLKVTFFFIWLLHTFPRISSVVESLKVDLAYILLAFFASCWCTNFDLVFLHTFDRLKINLHLETAFFILFRDSIHSLWMFHSVEFRFYKTNLFFFCLDSNSWELSLLWICIRIITFLALSKGRTITSYSFSIDFVFFFILCYILVLFLITLLSTLHTK